MFFCSKVHPMITKASGSFDVTKFTGNGSIVDEGRNTWDIGLSSGGRNAYVFVSNILTRRAGTKITVNIKSGSNSYADIGFIQNLQHPADQGGNAIVYVNFGPTFSMVYNPNEGTSFVPISVYTNIDLYCELIFKLSGTILRVNGANVYEGTDDTRENYYAYIGSGDENNLVRFENLRVVRN